jgi:hypothetical protein
MPAARSTDPSTSSQYPTESEVSAVQERVLMLLMVHGPKCDRHLIDLYRQHYPLPEQYASESSVRTRRCELVDKGLVAYTGRDLVLRGIKRDRRRLSCDP